MAAVAPNNFIMKLVFVALVLLLMLSGNFSVYGQHHQQARIGRVLAGYEDLYLGMFSTEEEAAIAYEYFAEAMSKV
ncbi:hypothetical protein COLO4_22274 [Corchorus olitorius]|uniref:Uncharacterized protein n=1 Tax=Corchorus olitorius TaxID=93759 RepID=A0A1R3IN26_9ROSI|nr:hypothetical protein COLO4_22274 [Corchorus olitorius]